MYLYDALRTTTPVFCYDLHDNIKSKESAAVSNPYKFFELLCPSDSVVTGLEKRGTLCQGTYIYSHCVLCKSINMRYSLCSPENCEKISPNINFGILVVHNSYCQIGILKDHKDDSTPTKCFPNFYTESSKFCGLKLSLYNGNFDKLSQESLILCSEEPTTLEFKLTISLATFCAITFILILAVVLLLIRINRSQSRERPNDNINDTEIDPVINDYNNFEMNPYYGEIGNN